MDEKGFISFMKKKRKSERAIATCIANTKELETYLEDQGKSLTDATVNDIESFAIEHLDKKRVSKFMWTLSHYFSFIDNKTLLAITNQIRSGKLEVSKKSFKIKEFRGVQQEHAAALAALGIIDTAQMLESGKTPSQRQELVEKTGLKIDVIEELVKLSDLSRIQGLKGIRARLYYDAGFDLLEKLRRSHIMSSCESRESSLSRLDLMELPHCRKKLKVPLIRLRTY
jgi:hypothetical protein